MLSNDFLIDQQEDEDLRCLICNFYFSQKTKPYLLPCNHNLCDKCINGIVNKNMNFCPICRKEFTLDERKNFKVNYSFLNLVLKILKTKNIYCSKCQKINNWNEHHVVCDEKNFKESNEILEEIKELSEKACFILKFIDKHKNILEKSKKEIKQNGKEIICSIHNKFEENFHKTIDNFFKNIPNLKFDENFYEIKNFIELCNPLGFIKKSPRYGENEKPTIFKKKLDISCSFNNIGDLHRNFTQLDMMSNQTFNNINDGIVKSNFSRNQINNNQFKNFEDFDTQMNENAICSLPDELEEEKIESKIKNINNVTKLNAFKINTPKRTHQLKLANLLENQTNNFTYNFNFATAFDNKYEKSEATIRKSSQKIIVRNDKIEIINIKDKGSIINNNDSGSNEMVLKKNTLVSKILNNEQLNSDIHRSNISIPERSGRKSEKIMIKNQIVKVDQLKELEVDKLNFSHDSIKGLATTKDEPIVITNEAINKVIAKFNSTKEIVDRVINYKRQVEWTTDTIHNQINNNFQHLNNTINNMLYGIFDNITNNFTNYHRKYIINSIDNSRKIALFDIRKNKFEIKEFESILKFKLCSLSTSVEFDDNDLVFISGGKTTSGGIFGIGDDNSFSNTFIIIKFSTKTIEYSGQLPRKRGYHTSLYFNYKLFIVGGLSTENIKLRECECYNLSEKIWELMPSMNISRCATSLCVYNTQYLYAFRGWTTQELYLDSIEMLNINDFSLGWQLINIQDPGLSWGVASNSSITIYNDNKIFICGGQRNNKLLDECFIFDPIRKEVYRTKDLCKKGMFNSLGSIYDNKMYLIDFKNETEKRFGCHIFEFEKNVWKIIYL